MLSIKNRIYRSCLNFPIYLFCLLSRRQNSRGSGNFLKLPENSNRSVIFKLDWCHFVMAMFVFKAGCIVCFTMMAFTCFAEKNNREILSAKEKKEVRSSLYFLWGLDEAKEKKRTEKLKQQEELREQINRLLEAIKTVDEEREESEGIEDSDEITEEEEDSDKIEGKKTTNEEHESKLANILAIKNSSYVITLFQRNEKLRKWLKRSPELIHLAIQFGNLDLIRFFSERGGLINAAREISDFSPLHTAIIARRLSVIQFFLDHPKTNLGQKSVWGDNLFHMVSLIGPQNQGDKKDRGQSKEKKVDKLEIFNLLFQPGYFLRIFDLLIAPNNHNETVLDFARRDDMPKKREIIKLLERKIKLALQFKELPEEELKALQLKVRSEMGVTSRSEEGVQSLLLKVLSGDDAESLLLKALFEDEVDPLLLEKLSKEEKESLLLEKLPEDEVKTLLLKKLSKEEKESLQIEELSENEMRALLIEKLPEDELESLLLKKLSKEEKESLLLKKLSEDKEEPLESEENQEIDTYSLCVPTLFVG